MLTSLVHTRARSFVRTTGALYEDEYHPPVSSHVCATSRRESPGILRFMAHHHDVHGLLYYNYFPHHIRMHASGENLEPAVRRRPLHLPDYAGCHLRDGYLQHYIGRRDPSASRDNCVEVAHSNRKESGHQLFVRYRFNVSNALGMCTLDT